jgi:thiol:disulfide interchange protein
VKPARSPIVVELGWLAYFLSVFAIAVYAMVIFVVPHHFNDKVAIALAGLFAALVMILTRAKFGRPTQR